MEKKKSNNIAVCIICGILTAFGIVASIIPLVGGSKGIGMVGNVADIVVSSLIGYYAFIGYRKPHGNIMKFIMLIYTVPRFIAIYWSQLAPLSRPWQAITAAIIIGLCGYITGRLHKVKQNIVFMGIVVIIILLIMILDLKDGIFSMGVFAPAIIWIDIFVAYVLRYKEHKEAGLVDAPKAK